jgi:hypothetical protein
MLGVFVDFANKFDLNIVFDGVHFGVIKAAVPL